MNIDDFRQVLAAIWETTPEQVAEGIEEFGWDNYFGDTLEQIHKMNVALLFYQTRAQ